MSDLDLAALRSLAEAAPAGPWPLDEDGPTVTIPNADLPPRDDGTINTGGFRPELIRYLAAVSPDVVLALLDRIGEREAAAPSLDPERLDRIIAAYEKTMLDHDTGYDDFAEVVRAVRYERWVEERDARAVGIGGEL